MEDFEEEGEETTLETLAVSLFKFAIFGSITFVLGWYCVTVISGSATLLQWIGFVFCIPMLLYTFIKSGFAITLAGIDIIVYFLRFVEFIIRKRG